MFDFDAAGRRLTTWVHPLPAGVSAVCILGAEAEPAEREGEPFPGFLWRPYLEQRWGEPDSPMVNFVLMNPSSADAEYNDATSRKCWSIAVRHGFGGLIITEVWALRSTGNEWLLGEPGAAGGEMPYTKLFTFGGPTDIDAPYYQNLMTLRRDMDFIKAAAENPRVTTIYCGWGSHAGTPLEARVGEVAAALRETGKELVCGGQNEDGSPRYVLYTPAEAAFVPFTIN